MKWIKEDDVYYCSECGVGLYEHGQSGEPIYFIDGCNRENPERRNTYVGWSSWLMKYCPYCGEKSGSEDKQMNLSKAYVLFHEIASGKVEDEKIEDYLQAIDIIANIETHNSVKKSDIIAVLQWLVSVIEPIAK